MLRLKRTGRMLGRTNIVTGYECEGKGHIQLAREFPLKTSHLTMTPITERVNISQEEAVLLSNLDICNSTCNFAGDESSPSTRALVIE